MSISSAIMYIYIYLERYQLVSFFLKYITRIYWNFLILNVDRFERFSHRIFSPMINLAREGHVLNIYRELVWKLRDSRYLIAGYKEERRNSIGEYDRFVCFVFVIYVVIKLSIFDISSDKFDDTRWIKVHGSVLDGASSFLASCFQTCQFSNWSEFEWPLDGLMKLIPWLPSDAISIR